MTNANQGITLRHLDMLFCVGRIGGLSDSQLLERFASRRDEGAELAFRALIERHGPMIRRVCRGILGDADAADDAFQATFLVLVRRAGSLWVGDSLGPWLHQVARRTATHARSAEARRRRHERQAAELNHRLSESGDPDDLESLVHEEVGRLPERYRVAVVLCLLEGLTPEVAATAMNCPVGTMHSRLARGREQLRGRLRRRGVALPAVLLTLDRGRFEASAAVPRVLADATIRAALRLVAAGVVPASVAAPAGIISRAMLMNKIGTAAATLMILGVLAVGAAVLARQAPGAGKAVRPQPAEAQAPVAVLSGKPPVVDSLGDPLPSNALLRLGTLRFRPPSTVSDLALSPDELTLVSVGGELIAWDAATGKERWRAPAGDPGFVGGSAAYGQRGVAFSADGARFYTPGRTGTISSWETATGRHEVLTVAVGARGLFAWFRPEEGRDSARSIDVTPDGKTLALGGPGGVVACDLTGKVLYRIDNRPEGPLKFDGNDRLTFHGHSSLARFSPDGKILAVVTSDQPEQVRLCDAVTGRELRRIALAARLVRLAFSPDGKTLATTERDSAVRLYGVETGNRAWSHVIKLTNIYENYTSAIAFSPDGKLLAACATDNRIYLIDPATGEEVAGLSGHDWYPWALAFSSKGSMLYSSGWDPAIRRWDVAARKGIDLPSGVHASPVVAASPAGPTLAYVDASGTIRLVDSAGGAERRTLGLPGAGYSQLAFSNDGRLLAGGGTVGDQVHVAVWDAASGELRHRWDWPKGRDPHSSVESLQFTPDGRRLAAAVFRQSAAYLWDLPAGKQVAKIPHNQIYGLSISPDGDTLATAGWDSIVRTWGVEAGEPRREVAVAKPDPGGDPRMYAVRYAPGGGIFATAHMDGTVRIWQADDLLLRSQFQVGARFMFGALEFSPDGLWLATGAGDGSVEVWDPSTGSKVWDGGRHQSEIYSVGFDRDARSLVSGGNDGVCYLWDLQPTGEPAAEEASRLRQDLAEDDGPAAFRAMGALSRMPDRAVPLLAEMLRPVQTLADLDRISEGVAPEENQRRRRLRKILIGKDPNVESAVAARRAVALLARLGTPDAIGLLESLAARDREGDLGRITASALDRLKMGRKP